MRKPDFKLTVSENIIAKIQPKICWQLSRGEIGMAYFMPLANGAILGSYFNAKKRERQTDRQTKDKAFK